MRNNRANFVLTLALIPLILSIGIAPALSFADDDIDSETECREGLVLVFRTTANDFVCLSKDSAEHWEKLGLGEIVGDMIDEKPTEKSDLNCLVNTSCGTQFVQVLG